MKTYRLIVNGIVHGINYRKFVLSVAQAHRYKGFTRNLLDGGVEVIINAEFEEELEFFISKLYDGSMFSHVEDIACKKIAFISFDGFERR